MILKAECVFSPRHFSSLRLGGNGGPSNAACEFRQLMCFEIPSRLDYFPFLSLVSPMLILTTAPIRRQSGAMHECLDQGGLWGCWGASHGENGKLREVSESKKICGPATELMVRSQALLGGLSAQRMH